jgi:predicted metal-binding protein
VGEVLQKIVTEVPSEELYQDLKKYRRYCLELGATSAEIIRAREVIIEYRVLAKCLVPRCPVSGTNINCPPLALTPEDVKRMVNEFEYAVFFKLDFPYDTCAECSRNMKLKSLEVLGKLEARAYYEGYYLAVGFSGASCKTTLCPEQDCSALKPGEPCRHPLKGRPSMHAVGMDAYKMAARVGWEIYPIGKATKASEVPFVSCLGVVFIH